MSTGAIIFCIVMAFGIGYLLGGKKGIEITERAYGKRN